MAWPHKSGHKLRSPHPAFALNALTSPRLLRLWNPLTRITNIRLDAVTTSPTDNRSCERIVRKGAWRVGACGTNHRRGRHRPRGWTVMACTATPDAAEADAPLPSPHPHQQRLDVAIQTSTFWTCRKFRP